MRFSLLNILLIFTLVSVALAWCLDRSAATTDITGSWYSELFRNGYRETLVIDDDGNFKKTRDYKLGEDEYCGNVTVDENGIYSFHVTSKNERPIGKQTIDLRFQCRCAVDDQNNLIIKCIVDPTKFDSRDEGPLLPLEWHSYSPRSFEQQFDDLVSRVRDVGDAYRDVLDANKE